MSRPQGAEDRPPEDLTARARIRDAALDQFARRGVKSATLKDIAEAAGVSVGLVQHHFRSKDALREACDEHVMASLVHRSKDEAAEPAAVVAGMLAGSERSVRYLARALVDGSPPPRPSSTARCAPPRSSSPAPGPTASRPARPEPGTRRR
ncbi:TetR/AcrR family transcriptional regulator [Thermocatellispora tengchongensis]|uniref:TetR/AcrR family transcriptional regulator n=1 Tax=Thermocatellispora tengchongensis TaxID=1073253 RepID=UPI00362BD3B4